MKIGLRYVVEDVDRHGNVRLYFRRRGKPKIRLPSPVGSPEFLAAYKAAMAGGTPTEVSPPRVAKAGSLRALCIDYFKSAQFRQLDPRTQKVRRVILDKFCQQDNYGDHPFVRLEARHIRKRRDALMDRPEAANGMVKAVRQLFAFATEYDLAERNPARDVAYLRTGSEGFHSWTIEEIRQFEQKHPVGTTARLALALAMYTGQRRSDLVLLGKQHVHDGRLVFTQQKNRNRKPVRLTIPIIDELRSIIDASPCGDLTFLVTAFNRPFTSNGFGNRFRKWCDEAGLPHCTVHGLRKATAARLAELGCSELEIMAVTGHRTSKEVIRYTRAASQEVRADNALKALAGGQSENKSVPPSDAVGEGGTL